MSEKIIFPIYFIFAQFHFIRTFREYLNNLSFFLPIA